MQIQLNLIILFLFSLLNRPTTGSMGSEKREFAFVVLKPTQGFGFIFSVSKPARGSEKYVVFGTTQPAATESSPHTVRGTTTVFRGCVIDQDKSPRYQV